MPDAAPQLSPRVARLRELALAYANEPDPCERGWAVMRSYDATRAEPMAIRRAKAVAAVLEAETLTLDEGDLLAGRVRRLIASHPGIHEGCRWRNAAAYPDISPNPHILKDAPVSPEFVEHLEGWMTRHVTVHEKARALTPPEVRRAMNVLAFRSGGIDMGHRLPRCQMLLERGVAALRAEALERMSQLDPTRADDVRKRVFYQSLVLVYDAMAAYGRRWAEMLQGMAAGEGDAERRAELEQMAAHCERAMAQPAATFWEGLQALTLMLPIAQAETTGSAGSFGRLDQYMLPLYEADLAAGRLTREQARELVECFFLKCYRTFDFHHTTIGGLRPDGRDGTNDLSSLCLEAMDRLRTPRDVAVRVHGATPPEFLRQAAAVVRLGLGRPDFWNDEVMVPALFAAGFDMEDALDYAPIGCVEITIPGKCNSRTMGHAVNLAKILEITLHGGRCALTGELVGIEHPADFATYDALHAAYRRQAARFIRLAIEEDVRGYVVQAAEHPLPVLSALTVGCLESGRDVMDGGAMYNPAGVNLFGVANVADSLAAIQSLVYEQQAVALGELREALAADFEGREPLRQRLLHRVPKFGNDDPSVDAIAAAEVAFYCDEIAKYPTPEGGRHLPLLFGCTPASVHHVGPKTGASADGRKARAPLATSVNPTHGRDLSGATAALNSVARIDFSQATGGASFIIDLHPTAVDGTEGLEKLVGLLKGFFGQGGLEIGINVVREEQLREAQAKPEEHGHLMVRVFGFSTQFISLDPELQEYVIAKSRHIH